MQTFPDGVRLEPGRGGLRRLVMETPAAVAEVYLHGAHVTHFQPRGQRPVLFMSEKSYWEPGKPIRGGVPICFPWFGPRRDGQPGPGHGVARLQEWELVSAEQRAEVVELALRLVGETWTVDYRVSIGAELGLKFAVRNTGGEPLQFEEALHTYLAVSDVRQVSITGLAGAEYLNTVGTPRVEREGAAPIRITAETDRIYRATQATCVVDDPGWQRRLAVAKTGSASTVLWNPWVAKSRAMPDFGDEEWPGMLCIETANVREEAVTLAPGQSHDLGAVVSVV